MTTSKKKGLGRGLSALFGESKESSKKKDSPNLKRLNVNVSDLSPNKYQPRVHFDKDKLQELANSIKKNGIIQPIRWRIKLIWKI